MNQYKIYSILITNFINLELFLKMCLNWKICNDGIKKLNKIIIWTRTAAGANNMTLNS